MSWIAVRDEEYQKYQKENLTCRLTIAEELVEVGSLSKEGGVVFLISFNTSDEFDLTEG